MWHTTVLYLSTHQLKVPSRCIRSNVPSNVPSAPQPHEASAPAARAATAASASALGPRAHCLNAAMCQNRCIGVRKKGMACLLVRPRTCVHICIVLSLACSRLFTPVSGLCAYSSWLSSLCTRGPVRSCICTCLHTRPYVCLFASPCAHVSRV